MWVSRGCSAAALPDGWRFGCATALTAAGRGHLASSAPMVSSVAPHLAALRARLMDASEPIEQKPKTPPTSSARVPACCAAADGGRVATSLTSMRTSRRVEWAQFHRPKR